jgi:hypothetical protein
VHGPAIVSGDPGGAQLLLVPYDNPYLASTHFTLDLGTGLAIAVRPRFVARVEVQRDLHAPRGIATPVILPNGSVSTFAPETRIASRWNLHVGASYGFGVPIAAASEPPMAGRWMIGPQFGYTMSTSANAIGTLGMFATYRLSRYCDADFSAGGFLSDSLSPSVYEGGRVMQGVGGVRLGVRGGRLGVFFKARAGVNSYSKVAKIDTNVRYLTRSTMPVIDIGGVVDASLTRRLVLRMEIGETLTFAPGAMDYPAQAIYSLPMRVGIGWRF